MSGFVGCMGYGLQFDKLDLKAFKENRRGFEDAKLSILLEEWQKGYYVSRWNKATKKGTNIACKKIQSKEQSDKELGKIEDYMKEVNKEFGFTFKFEYEKTKQMTDCKYIVDVGDIEAFPGLECPYQARVCGLKFYKHKTGMAKCPIKDTKDGEKT